MPQQQLESQPSSCPFCDSGLDIEECVCRGAGYAQRFGLDLAQLMFKPGQFSGNKPSDPLARAAAVLAAVPEPEDEPAPDLKFPPGHDELCHFCGELCSALSSDQDRFPLVIPLDDVNAVWGAVCWGCAAVRIRAYMAHCGEDPTATVVHLKLEVGAPAVSEDASAAYKAWRAAED